MIQLVSKTTELPMSLASLKKQCDIAEVVTYHDNQITDYAWSAIDLIEGERGISLVQQTWDKVLCKFPSGKNCIRLEMPPTQSVTSITYYDSDNTSQTWDSANYYVVLNHRFPAEISPVISYPSTYTSRPNAVTIRYVAGYSKLPPRAEQAIKFIVRTWFDNPASEGESTAEIKLGLDRILGSLDVGWM